MPDFPIVDAHVHLYDPGRFAYWMRKVPLLNRLHDETLFLQQSEGVDVEKIVWVEVTAPEGWNIDEANWIVERTNATSRVAGIVPSAALERGAEIEPELVALSKLPRVSAIRRLIQGHEDEPGWCLRPKFVEGIKLLPRYGLGFEICVTQSQLHDVVQLVERCPDVRFMLDHIGKPAIREGLWEPWASDVKRLSTLPNVVCKISGVTTEADHASWNVDQLAPFIEHAINSFGYTRCAFGSDWPVSEQANSYLGWVNVVDRVTAGSSRAELLALYRNTATEFYRL